LANDAFIFKGKLERERFAIGLKVFATGFIFRWSEKKILESGILERCKINTSSSKELEDSS